MARERPLNATSIKALDERLTLAAEQLDTVDPLSASFTLRPCPEDLSTQYATNDEEELGFADPVLKKALDEQFSSDAAHNFKSWDRPVPKEVNDALVFAQKSFKVAQQNIGRKLHDADRHFRDTCGGNDPMVLSSFEAACIFRTNIAMNGRIQQTERLLHLFTHFLCSRQKIINQLSKTVAHYHITVQELLWSDCSQKASLFGKALNENGIDGADLATLQAKSNAQSHKIHILEAQLDLLSAMNRGCQSYITDIQNFAAGMIQSDCGWAEIPKPQIDMSKLDWEAYEKEIRQSKRVIQSTQRRSELSEFALKEKTDEMMIRFMEVLLTKLRELGGDLLVDSLTQEVFGSLIGAAAETSVLPCGVPIYSRVRSALEKSDNLPQPLNDDSQSTRQLRHLLTLKSYFPEEYTACALSKEDWAYVCFSDLIATRKESRTAIAEATQARKLLEEQFELLKKSYSQAEEFRRLYDCHILTCKKSAQKEHMADKRLGEWADRMLDLIPSNDDLRNGWTMLPDKEKWDRLTKAVKQVIRDRDEAIRKNEPLSKKLAQKDKTLLEKDTLIANANEAQDQIIEEKNKQLNEMSLRLDRKEAERQSAIAEADKIRNEWQKKLQRRDDKNGTLEKHLKAMEDQLKTTKLDLEATLNEILDTKSTLEKVKMAGREVVKKNANLQRERDESRSQMLSLKSNEEIVKDRISKAISAALKKAEEEKDARIAELEGLLVTREQARLADEETIRELSRIKEIHMKCKK